ncbi:hypothetical protein ACO0R3_001234 [Hanseniaspora guilliermondii]
MAGKFRKSIKNRNHSLSTGLKPDSIDDLTLGAKEMSRTSSHSHKKPSSISMFKKKLSNAAHNHGYHNHNKDLTSLAMTKADTDVTKAHAKHHNMINVEKSTQQKSLPNDHDNIAKSDDSQPRHSLPLQRTFSTPSFISNRFKKSSKESLDRPMDLLTPSKSSDKISGLPISPVISPTVSSGNLNLDFPNTSQAHKLRAKTPNKDSSLSLNFDTYNQDSNGDSPAHTNKDVEEIMKNELGEPSDETPESNDKRESEWVPPESWDVMNNEQFDFNNEVLNDTDTSYQQQKFNLGRDIFHKMLTENKTLKPPSDKEYDPLDSKKNSVSSLTTESISPTNRNKGSIGSIDEKIGSLKQVIPEEQRADSFDSDNDGIILTKEKKETHQSLSPFLQNEIFTHDKISDSRNLTNFNNLSVSEFELSHIRGPQNSISDLKLAQKEHFNSIASPWSKKSSLSKVGVILNDGHTRSSLSSIMTDAENDQRVISEATMNSYELYYNDFSSFDMNRKYVIKIFNMMTSTFTTLSCTMNTTVEEMLPMLKKKFNYSAQGNFQISLRIGKLSKVLHMKAKPISIQLRLLLLSGYRKNHDPLNILGIEDLSFVFQFLMHPILTSQLSKEKEELILKRGDFVHADLRDMDLSRPPVIFYQKAEEIESLDLSANANSFLPLDFIESATSLTSLRMVSVRASKFPQNITHITTLISLELSRNFIKSIPESINMLKNLTILNLQSNRLSSLPAGFGSLKHLQLLDLSSNLFTEYPEVINECTNLLQVDLSSNRIYKIPENINNLTKLAKLNFAYNNLTAVPNLKDMVNLRTINLKDNLIHSFKSSSKSLQYIYLSDNRISEFEDELPNLRTLDVAKNPLTSVYFKENVMNFLTTLNLSKANLTIVPSIIWKKFVKLRRLELDENNLTQISEAIENLTELNYLSFSRNKLESLPKSIVKLKKLRFLDLHSNNIAEFVPDWGKMQLTHLNLSSNGLLYWQDSLVNFSEENMPLFATLKYLSVADNRLNSKSSIWVGKFKNLVHLNVSFNVISELAVNRMANLEELYMSGNQLTSLPGEFIENLPSLRVLMVNNNRLQSLPAELSSLKNLSVLDASNNNLKYNIGNFQYDYNWLKNTDLKYLSFSGNKRFEISDTVINNTNYADLTHLRKLLVLSLMDVTLKTSKIPDEAFNLRMRTSESKVNNMAYGVADYIGSRSFVNYRDNAVQRFRGKIDESLLMLIDGKNEISNSSNRLPKFLRDMYPEVLSRMLDKYGDDSEANIKNALRHSFLQLNKDLNSKAQETMNGHKSSNSSSVVSNSDECVSMIDLSSGAALTVVYIKDKMVYTANIGDTMAILSRSTGDHAVLTLKHNPGNPREYVRIRIAGGYVNNGKVDGVSDVSRAVGFFHLLPHIHASPDINVLTLTKTDEMLIIATNDVWNYFDYETASDIARSNRQQPMEAAAQIRDFAIAYGCKESICVVCISLESKLDFVEEFTGQINLNKESLMSVRRSENTFEDSVLRRLEPEISPPTGNLSIVFTDIKNSTSLWESFPDAMRSAIKTHNSIMRRNLRLFGGYEVKTEGDAFMVAFPSPLAALNWCLTVQLKLLQASWPLQITNSKDGCLVKDENDNTLYLGLSVRMGIHWGKPVPEKDVVTQRMDYLGPMVNKAARVSSVADGGQITLSMDFITEFRAILDMSRSVHENGASLKEAYGDEVIGEVLERQLHTLNDIGYCTHDLGETKMKGLETKEFITLIYPEKIKGRLSMQQAVSDDMLNTRETLFFLRNITLKLEDIVSFYDCDHSTYFDKKEVGKLFNFTKDTRNAIVQTGNEKDLIKFLDHLITRLESLILALNVRQKMYGHLERREQYKSVFEILDDLADKMNPK